MKALTTWPAGCASPPTSRMSWTFLRQRRQTVGSLMLYACPARGLAFAPLPPHACRRVAPRDRRRNRLERRIGPRAVGPAGLREIGTAAAALAAEHLGADANEIDSIVGAREVLGDADDEPRLTLVADADHGDDAGAQLLLGLVDEPAQVLGRNTVHGAARSLTGPRSRTAEPPPRRRLRAAAQDRAWPRPAGARACGARR